MRALAVRPGHPGGGSLVDGWPQPDPAEGDVVIRTLAVGVCGTDREILAGEHGQAPPGQDALVLGHEVLGEVDSAPAASGVVPGDRVVEIVRRPDPVPCLNARRVSRTCAATVTTPSGASGGCTALPATGSAPGRAGPRARGARHPRRPRRAGLGGRQGVGARRADRP